MTWDLFTNVMLLVIFVSFVIERGLAVFFETRYYIEKVGSTRGVKESIALIVGVLSAWTFDINIILLAHDPEAAKNFAYSLTFGNAVALLLSGSLFAGGSKLSLKLFRDTLAVRSSAEDARLQPLNTVPAFPADAARAAAIGNSTASEQLRNLFKANGYLPAPK
jgi:hypothetical protein